MSYTPGVVNWYSHDSSSTIGGDVNPGTSSGIRVGRSICGLLYFSWNAVTVCSPAVDWNFTIVPGLT